MAKNRSGSGKSAKNSRVKSKRAAAGAGVEVENEPLSQETSAPTSRMRVAAAEAKRTSERSNKALSRLSLVARIVLFVAACVFSVIGVMGFIDAANTQTTSRAVTAESIKGEPVRHSLVLLSYDESDANVAYERDGVLDVFNRSNVSSDVFYLDARSNGANDDSRSALLDVITRKAAQSGGYDVIVAAGDEALSFVAYNQGVFGGVPTAFFAVDDCDLAKEAQRADVASGFVEDGSVALAYKTAFEMLPSAKASVVLVDGSPEANGMLKQLEASDSATLGGARDVWDVSQMTREALGERLAGLDSSSFVLLLAANRDSEGNAYTPSLTAHFVGKSAPVPVFAAQGGVGEGVSLAAFVDRQAEGINAAALAVDLMNGKGASQVEVASAAPECCVIDAQKLSSFGVNLDSAPDNATYINESAFNLRVLRPMLMPLLFLLLAVLCIAGFGIIGFRRSIKSNRAIIESRNDLQYRLYHDLLTDLPNRYTLEQFASEPSTEGKMASVMQVDLEDFTDINDSYGHAFGDEVIEIVAKRLKDVPSELLSRSGGDEFTLVFDHTLSAECTELNQIARIFSEPVIIGGTKVDVSARVGVVNREAGMTGEDMIIYADLAKHNAKETNARHPVFYTSDLRENMERKLEITSYLKQAISDERVQVLWQPQVDTESLKVCGYEALCRIEGNKYYPDQFIPVAEMSGLVNPLDRIVTKKVIQQLGVWLKEGREDIGIASINFSAAQLRDKGYCDFLAEQLAENGVPASLIKIEITESMIIGNEDEADRLFARLRSMGITLALDDFGTGYSSLYRMANRPVDVVKLDKSLVDTFMVPGKEGFIDDVTRLIHGLGKAIVVEGVETYEQYQMCLNLGCDVIQGYFFARPMTAEEAINLDPSGIVASARVAAGDKTRNGNWSKYDRDEHGRWKKGGKKS